MEKEARAEKLCNAHQPTNIAWPGCHGKIVVQVVHDNCFAAVLMLQEYPP